VLQVGVILVGALVLAPGTDAMRDGTGGAEALLMATGQSVFKPQRRSRTLALAPAGAA
jgi:hypothetical protein